MRKVATVIISPEKIILNGQQIETFGYGHEMLTTFYKTKLESYPKFYKMDILAKLGYVASELLINSLNEDRFVERSDRAIIFTGSHASEVSDINFIKTISDKDNFFPSPSIFVYTLPNIVTGEIAIRNKYYGETEFYVIDKKDDSKIEELVEAAFSDKETLSALAGWIDCKSENEFECEIFIIEKE